MHIIPILFRYFPFKVGPISGEAAVESRQPRSSRCAPRSARPSHTSEHETAPAPHNRAPLKE